MSDEYKVPNMLVDGSFVEDLLTDRTVSVVGRLLVRRDEVRLLNVDKPLL